MREADVAALLGVSDRRVRLRWYESRLALQQAIQQEGTSGQ